MNHRPPREDLEPWYKQFWPWFLISLPASAVIAGIITINLAMTDRDGVVTDDYYKKGLGIHRDVEKLERARALGLTAQVDYDVLNSRVVVELAGIEPAKLGALDLQLSHPTRQHQDQRMPLSHVEGTRFEAKIIPLGPADWHISVVDRNGEWRLPGRIKLPEETSVKLPFDD